MKRKLVLSEAFKDGKMQIVLTVRIPNSLYKRINEDATEQNTSISILVRDFLAVHYLPEHLKGKLKKKSFLSAGEIALVEGLRAHLSDLVKVLDEIDILRGQNRKLDPFSEDLIEQAVEKALASRLEVDTSKGKVSVKLIFPDSEPQQGLHVRIPKKLLEALEGEAKERGQNLSELIRELLTASFIFNTQKKKNRR